MKTKEDEDEGAHTSGLVARRDQVDEPGERGGLEPGQKARAWWSAAYHHQKKKKKKKKGEQDTGAHLLPAVEW
jgi:hypothetical protein